MDMYIFPYSTWYLKCVRAYGCACASASDSLSLSISFLFRLFEYARVENWSNNNSPEYNIWMKSMFEQQLFWKESTA